MVFLRRNSLNPSRASKSLEMKGKQEIVWKTNDELIVVNKLTVESGTWAQQKFPCLMEIIRESLMWKEHTLVQDLIC